MKQYLRKIASKFNDIKFRYKLVATYVCIGLLPVFVLGMFCYSQSRKQLMIREKNNVNDYLMQSVASLDNQLEIYNNLSKYVAFNSNVADVVNRDCPNITDKLKQYQEDLDPVLLSLKYCHSGLRQVTIYSDKIKVAHDTFVAPMSKIRDNDWFDEVAASAENVWFADREKKMAFSARTLPLLEQNGNHGILYMSVDYNTLFENFTKMSNKNYGFFVTDEDGTVVFEYQSFDEHNDNFQLTMEELHDASTDKYTIVNTTISQGNWNVYLYKPNSVIADSVRSMAFGIILVCIICIAASLLIVPKLARVMVGGIERLTENMAKVEAGEMAIMVTSESKDEVGELIRGFGNMIEKINHLINEVYESKITQKEYEMKALQAQINPHFLYNSLSLINWKALEAEQPDISRITLLLSSFYRTALNRGKNILPVRDEISNMRSYLDIQLMMHDNDFDVEIDVDEEIMECESLNLILQPLVENAIDHGIDLKTDGRGLIKITGRRHEEDNILIEVEDNGVGMEPEKAGLILTQKSRGYGVRNVNERIQLFFGKEYCLSVKSAVGKGTKISILMPYKLI